MQAAQAQQARVAAQHPAPPAHQQQQPTYTYHSHASYQSQPALAGSMRPHDQYAVMPVNHAPVQQLPPPPLYHPEGYTYMQHDIAPSTHPEHGAGVFPQPPAGVQRYAMTDPPVASGELSSGSHKKE